MRYTRTKLGVSIGSFFSSFLIQIPFITTDLGAQGHVYPVLTRKTSFLRTLDRGEKLFERYTSAPREAGLKELNGTDLGLGVNHKEFEAAQAASKEASNASLKVGAKDVLKLDVYDIAALEKDVSVPKTDDSANSVSVWFSSPTRRQKKLSSGQCRTSPSTVIGTILDQTSSYAKTEVTNVQVINGYVLHIGQLKYGQLSASDNVVSSDDELRRWPLRNNPTATHILNFVLRETLGDLVGQKGSLVAPTKLRLDFSRRVQTPLPELDCIERMSIDWIKRNVKVFTKNLSHPLAPKIPGLRAGSCARCVTRIRHGRNCKR
ncbi:hypothetical protein BJY52DRAFT_1252790 [Lactarius psammicola]|nr:hypothetical protein BJY52DRAFT_1252790 [Lactarius psammicola]